MSAPRSHAEPPELEATPSPFANFGVGLDRSFSRGLARITEGALGPYQSAIVRIGFSLTWLAFLLREFPNRSQLYGPDSAWGFDLARRLLAGNHAFSVLMWNDGRAWFEFCYAFAIVASAALLLGWRTRTAALMFMVGVLSLQNRSIYMGDGGDNVVHIMAIYLAFTRCGQVWSLDSRRARRARLAAMAAEPAGAGEGDADAGSGAAGTAEAPAGKSAGGGLRGLAGGLDRTGIVLWIVFGAGLLVASAQGRLSTGWGVVFWGCWLGQAVWWAVRRYLPGEPRTVMEIVSNIVHNGAMLVIVVEVCLIYSTAGWYKIQGSHWQDGTALYYPLHLDDFTPWPALSHTLAGSGIMVMLISYGTVIVQVAFPFTLFNRRVKNVLLCAMMLEHASIAIVLGLPFFSLAMIAADAVFLPTNFLRWAGERLVAAVGPRRERPAAVLPGPRPAEAADAAVGSAPPTAAT